MNENKVLISNPDKVLYPGSGISKKEIVAYYELTGPYMLPFVEDRPLTTQRYPNGIDEENFYQKEAPEYFPGFIKRLKVKEKETESKEYITVNNITSLLYLANHAALVLHVWQSRKGSIRKPDQIMWDLDPSDEDFEKVRKGALLMKAFLQKLELEPFIKTTGSRGLHLVIPIKNTITYTRAKKFTSDVAEVMARNYPDLFTTEFMKKNRGHRVFIDYLRNQYGHTAVAPYSLRAKENAPAATPIHWDELNDKRLDSQAFKLSNMPDRLKEAGDVWKDFYKKPQELDIGMERLKSMTKKNP